jgi:hypothetical protein
VSHLLGLNYPYFSCQVAEVPAIPDFTNGVGRKWKEFFIDLEINHGLLGLPGHIWLLHWLFLEAINQEVHKWAEDWNHHRIAIRGNGYKSPRDMFLWSMVEDGARGLDELVDPETYGIDWETYDNADITRHLVDNNSDVWDDGFEEGEDVEEGGNGNGNGEFSLNCPIPEDLVGALRAYLENQVDLSSENMLVRRLLWQKALEFCQNLGDGFDQYVALYFLFAV